MKLEDAIKILEAQVKCDNTEVCDNLESCEECANYVTIPLLSEAHKIILKELKRKKSNTAYIFAKGGYEGCSFGEKVFLSEEKAKYELMLEQEKGRNSPYYTYPGDDFPWGIEELELDDTEL